MNHACCRHRLEYHCNVRDQYGNSTGVVFSIYVDGIEARADGIRDFYVTPGQAAELKVNTMAPENSRLKYTWYEGDVDEGTIIEGADSNVYRIDSAMKSSPYTCKVEDLNGNSSKTVEFNVYVDNKLEAYVDGTKKDWVNICTPPGEETVLKVSATAVDSSQLKYTWIGYEFSIEDESIIEGADSAEYRPGNVTGSYNYRCVVSDQYGNSKDVVFKINQLYAYADEEGNQETDLHVSPGEAAELRVFAGAEDPSQLKYTWYIRIGRWEDDDDNEENSQEKFCCIVVIVVQPFHADFPGSQRQDVRQCRIDGRIIVAILQGGHHLCLDDAFRDGVRNGALQVVTD